MCGSNHSIMESCESPLQFAWIHKQSSLRLNGDTMESWGCGSMTWNDLSSIDLGIVVVCWEELHRVAIPFPNIPERIWHGVVAGIGWVSICICGHLYRCSMIQVPNPCKRWPPPFAESPVILDTISSNLRNGSPRHAKYTKAWPNVPNESIKSNINAGLWICLNVVFSQPSFGHRSRSGFRIQCSQWLWVCWMLDYFDSSYTHIHVGVVACMAPCFLVAPL